MTLETQVAESAVATMQHSSTAGTGIRRRIKAHPRLTVSLALVAILVILLVVGDGLAERRLARQIDAIRAKGEWLTAEDIAVAVPMVPRDENMTLALLDVMGRMEWTSIPEEKRRLLPGISSPRQPMPGRRGPAEQLDAARWFLGHFSGEMAAVHEALQLERGSLNVQYQSPLTAVPIPDAWTSLSNVPRVVALELTLAAHDGDGRRTAELLNDLFRFDNALSSDPLLLSALGRIGSNKLIQRQILETVNLCDLDEATLSNAQKALARWARDITIKTGMMEERVVRLDAVEWIRANGWSAPTAGSPASAPSLTERLWPYLPILPEMDESFFLAGMTALVDAIAEPDASSIQRARAAAGQANAVPFYGVMSKYGPALSYCVDLWVEAIASNRALQAALACERHRLAAGDWPESLAALVPQYLEAVPGDPFDSNAIRYCRTQEGIRVWSIGLDMKDDGGKIGTRLKAEDDGSSSDLGWLLLNPDLRNRAAEVVETPSQP